MAAPPTNRSRPNEGGPPVPGKPRGKSTPEEQPWRVEGAREGDGDDKGGKGPRFRFPRWLLWTTLGILLLNVLFASQVPSDGGREPISYTFFKEQVEAGNVTEVSTQGDLIQGDFEEEVQPPAPPAQDGEEADKPEKTDRFQTIRPVFEEEGQPLDLLESNDVVVNAEPLDDGRSVLTLILLYFGPTLLIIGLFVLLMRRAGGGAAGLTGLGRSKAKRYEASAQRTTFEDVAGIEEADEELVEIVDFLKTPDK